MKILKLLFWVSLLPFLSVQGSIIKVLAIGNSFSEDAVEQNLYELAKIEEDRFVQDCKLKVLRIQGEINKHNDLAVKSRDSLNPGEGLNPAEWVRTRHELARKLRVAKIELALAMQVDAEEFPADASESINLDDVKDDAAATVNE